MLCYALVFRLTREYAEKLRIADEEHAKIKGELEAKRAEIEKEAAGTVQEC